MEALAAATRKPALFFGLSDVGAIEKDMRADLLLLDANPLDDIRNTRAIAAVVSAGRLMEKRDIDRMLDEMANAASAWDRPPTGR